MPTEPELSESFDPKRTLAHVLAQTLPAIALGIGLINVTLAASHFLVLHGELRTVMSVLAAASGLFLLIAYPILTRVQDRKGKHWPHIFACIIAGLISVNTLTHIGMAGEMKHSTNIAIILISIGCFFTSPRYLALALFLVIAAWGLVVDANIPDPDWIHYGFMALLSANISIIVVTVRVRLLLQKEQLTFELCKQADAFRELSLRDGLTEVSNRRAFDESLSAEWKRCSRNGTPLSLLMMDVDDFKPFNDRYGHQDGDDCLKAVASILKKSLLRPGDQVYRYGGEEFAVLLPDTPNQNAEHVATTIRKAVEDVAIPHEDSQSKVITISVGVATATPGQDGNHEHLVKTADDALYEAKDSGRNRVVARSVQS